jgi:hypothetical protein
LLIWHVNCFWQAPLFLISLVSGQAGVIETDHPVDVTGTITVEKTPNKAMYIGAPKSETLYLTSGDIVKYNGHRLPVKKVEVVFDAEHFENTPNYKAAKEVAGTGKPVTLHGAFQWHHRFEQLYFEIE